MKSPLIFFLALLLISGCSDDFDPNKFVIIEDCKVLDTQYGQTILRAPGHLCEYGGDGNVYLHMDQTLAKFDLKAQKQIWTSKSIVHHDMYLDHNKHVLYTLERDLFQRDEITYIGFKIVAHSSENGEIISEWLSSEHQQSLDLGLLITPDPMLPQLPWPVPGIPTGARRYVDANQIELVSADNPLVKHHKAQEGDLLISLMDYSTLAVIDFKTGKIRSFINIPNSEGQIHTVSFFPQGSLSVFKNLVKKSTQPMSAAQELSYPDLEKVIWQYPPQLVSDFFSPYFSSVQKVSNDLYFIVDNSEKNSAFLFVNKHSKILYKLPFTSRKDGQEQLVYRAHIIEKINFKKTFGINLP